MSALSEADATMMTFDSGIFSRMRLHEIDQSPRVVADLFDNIWWKSLIEEPRPPARHRSVEHA